MNKSMQKVESNTTEDTKEQERRRRHFRDEYKKKIVADIISGKSDIENVLDPEGHKISKYLLQRWKTEYRGQRFAIDAISQTRGDFQNPVVTKESGPIEEVYQELIKLRNENNRLKAILAVDLGITIKSNDSIPYASKAYSHRF